jgi:hypothetical protein
MALPSATPANFPIGLPDVTITAVVYILNSIDMATETTRQIVRTDGNGDYADSQTRASSEPILGTMELQKAATTTVTPTAGTSFTYDFDKSGTGSTLEVTDVKLNHSGENADTFEIGIKLITYQG